MRVFLVAGSPQARRPEGDGMRPGPADRVIAVDAGLMHARAWGWPVHLLIGDLDSLPASELPAIGSIPIVTAPPAKDETDLELGLRQALMWGARSIVICGALGGRPDHMLANALLLASEALTGLDVCLVEGHERLRLLRGGEDLAITGRPGDLVSLLPVGGPATGVVTENLRYPLRSESLSLGQARGVSNVLLAREARVSLRDGYLLVYHRAGASARDDVWEPAL
jgi:thiamine pyrophosphokinase